MLCLPPILEASAALTTALAHLGNGDGSSPCPSGIVVVGQNRQLGWLTSWEVMAWLAQGNPLHSSRVGDVDCQPMLAVMEPDWPDWPELLRLTEQQPLCLVNGDYHPLGIVTHGSLLQALGRRSLWNEGGYAHVQADDREDPEPGRSLAVDLALLQDRQLSHLLIDITSRFVDVSEDRWDHEIIQALGQIGTRLNVDHAYLATFDAPWPQPLATATMTITHTWYQPHLPSPTPPTEPIPLANFPWAISELLQQRVVNVPCVAALPSAQAIEQQHWQRFGIVSLISVPLVERGEVVGFLGFASLSQTVMWEGYAVRLLEVLAQALGNAQTRLRDERSLAQAQAHNQAILVAIPDLMFRVGADGIYRSYITPPGAVDVLAAVANPVGQSLFDLLPAHLAQRQFTYLQQALATGQLQVYEQQLPVGDRLHDEEVRVIKSGEDEVLFMVRDISDRKSMERQLHDLNQSLEHKVAARTADLQAREAQIRAIVAAIPDLLVRVTREGHCVDCLPSRLVEITTGEDHHPEANSPIADSYSPGDYLGLVAPPRPEALAQAIATGAVQIYEQQTQQGDHILYQEVRLAAISPDEALMIVRNMTARKHIELALQASEAEFRRLAENIPAAIFRYRLYPDGRDAFTYVSPYVETLYGVKPEAALASTDALFSRAHPDDIPALLAAIRTSAQDLAPFYSEHRITAHDGTLKWVQVISSPEPQPHDEILWQGVILDISDRKRAELDRQALLQELSAFKQALDASAMVSMTDRQGSITYVNDGFVELSGYSRQELIGQSHRLVSSGYHSHYFFQDLWQNLLRGKVWRGEVCNRTKTGQLYWVDTTIVPFLNESGQPIKFLAVRFDITARWQAELALRSSNALLSTLSQAQAQFISAANRLDIFDDLLRQLLDLTNSEYALLGEVQETVSPHLGESFLKVRGVPHLYPQGEAYPAAAPPADSQGTSSHSTDSQSADPFADPMLADSASIQPSALLCKLHRLIRQVLKTGHPVSLQWPVGSTSAGQTTLVSFLGLPILQGSSLVGVVAVANRPNGYDEDMMDYLEPFVATCGNLIQGYRLERRRRATEERLHQTNEELARATQMKDEFLANMSHELRTPLNAILGMAEGLQEQIFGSINDRQLRALLTIEHSGTHLLALINDILDVAKIESGQIELDLAPVAIAPLCRSSLAFVKQQALKKHISLETQIADGLPPLWGDERRLRQVLINLLANAVKFTPKGGRIRLSVTALAPGEAAEKRLRIAVTDTGIGIAPEHTPTLFQPFIQIDSTLNRQYQGTGLGLALVKRLVELHGGQVGLTSQPGEGSCFTVDLPAAAQDTIHPAQGAEDAITPDLPPLILLAEDNQANLSTLSNYLGAKGFRLLVAPTGEEAIALAQAQPPNLVLVDLQRSETDGLGVIERLRQIPSLAAVPILALGPQPSDRDRCLTAGATDCLPQPVRLKDLAHTIQTLLGRGGKPE